MKRFKAGANIDSLVSGRTALGEALVSYQPPKLDRGEVVLKYGANPNLPKTGLTPLFEIVYRYVDPKLPNYRTDAYRQAMALLIRSGADPDIANAGEYGPKESPRALAQKATDFPELLILLNQPRAALVTPAVVIHAGEIALTGPMVSINQENGSDRNFRREIHLANGQSRNYQSQEGQSGRGNA